MTDAISLSQLCLQDDACSRWPEVAIRKPARKINSLHFIPCSRTSPFPLARIDDGHSLTYRRDADTFDTPILRIGDMAPPPSPFSRQLYMRNSWDCNSDLWDCKSKVPKGARNQSVLLKSTYPNKSLCGSTFYGATSTRDASLFADRHAKFA